MKKWFKSLACLVIMCFVFTPAAFAADNSESNFRQITPFYIGINYLYAGIKIDSSGLATCSGLVTLSDSSYSTDLLAELQKWNSSSQSYETIKFWTNSGSGYSGASIQKNWYVIRGKYCVKTTAKVYNSSGKLIDNASACSSEWTY
ncbi:hypothetical protein [Dehalobacterium formicoaceticum]|uniref:Uncharacterized protein n=1 Tax=Dehalobacterium formicoaceticum TaxID=51515 RepID=A0ABT1Y159_9FIRM|nr:hypothetical protein [Dehalobacterium formicoaceticum]MCR6544592.1 hypothetical protein [Dehalobacterium formicoaceticum]